MPLKGRIIVAIITFFLFFIVLNLIRKRRMKIEYSILWLGVSLIIFVMSIWQGLGDRIAYFMGIDYPPALFFLVAVVFILLILLHFSLEITKLKDQLKIVVQELSLLKQAVKDRTVEFKKNHSQKNNHQAKNYEDD
ncbi:DUF2304 domain-containing protein [bacterium]|nr:DUF2304 domain-containing protein [bacterium]